MFDDVDQHEVILGPDGSIVIPATLLEALRWQAGHRLLLEQTDDGVLITEIEAPGNDTP